MKKIFFLFFAFTVASSFAQHTNIMIGNNGEPEEPSIMINPKNPAQMVAGANIDKYYYSSDSGYTWTEGTLTSSYGVWGDPVIIVDTTGDFYFFHLSNPSFGNWIDRIVCQKSNDGGQTWNDGSYTYVDGTKAQDKQWAVVDPQNNVIYCTWTQFDEYGVSTPSDSSNILFSKSTDGGQTWSTVKRLNKIAGNCYDSDSTVEGAVPTVGPNGEVYVSWASLEGLIFDRSLDSGTTWLDEDIKVADMPGGWDMVIPGINRCNGLPITDCDRSNSQYSGNIYINWSDQRNGTTDTDIWFTKSTDGGNTWCEPKRVNDDPAGKQQFFTWMCVDQITGYIWFVFYDRRNYSDNKTDVYMAVSKDGGNTFINFKVSSNYFTPYAAVFIGDYNNISANNNIVRPVWTRMSSGSLSVWTAIIDTTFLGVDNFEEMSDFSLEQNSPNPFTDNTFISFKLHHACNVSLKVHDIMGSKIATIINDEKLPAGRHTRQFDASAFNLKSGVYYFSLVSNEKMMTRKMVLVK
ncbi:MAG: T9SS type A sorting domain-containing protein [Bacteroidota bacterium]